MKNLSQLGESEMKPDSEFEEKGFTMEITVLSRRNSGRISEMMIQLNDESIRLNDWQIRQVFSDADNKPLPSTLFLLKSSPSQKNQFYVIGAGYGHGRGMCQWGAIGQSLKGKSYKDILTFYYPGLFLNKIY